MNRHRIGRSLALVFPPLAVTFAALLLLGGCGTLQEIVEGSAKPTARLAAARLSDLSLDQATLDFDVEIENPYSVALPLTDLAYSIASEGREVLSGAAPIAGSVPARGARTVTVPAQIRFADLLAVLQGVRPGAVVPYAADLDLSVDAPGVGPLRLPLSKEGKLPVPTVPRVSLEKVDWQRLTLEEATAALGIRIENANAFPFDLSTFDYGLSLGGTRIVSTSLRREASFMAGGAGTLQIPVTIAPRDFGLALFRLLSGQGAGYELGGEMRVDTPYGPLALPFESRGTTVFTH